MDVEVSEDMLFACPSSQDTFDDANIGIDSENEMLGDSIDYEDNMLDDGIDYENNMLDDGVDSEDGMLEDGFDYEFDLWDTQSNAILTSPITDGEQDAGILHDSEETNIVLDEVYRPNEPTGPLKDRNWVIARVEQMLEDIVDGLLTDSNELIITLKSRSGLSRRDGSLSKQKQNMPPPKTRVISFPGANAQEAWRFTVLIRILELVHGCLIEEVVMTKRDIYYRHPDLFVKQSVVDRYVDDLACTFGVPRSLLNVTAAAKGLVAGNFILRRADGTSVNGLSETEGIMIPKINESDTLDLSSVHWILVIEKEATFRSLLSSPEWMKLGSQGLIVTAKGYPDLASRKFLRHIADQSPHIPMFGLVDYDPDGIAILSTYKHGSYRLAHENVTAGGTPGLDLPQIRWLGVRSHQFTRTMAAECDTKPGTMLDAQGLMRLTPRDRKMACQMLEWDVCAENGPEPEWRHELQTMLMLNIKAEMQILDELPGGLTSWLGGELAAAQGC